MKHCKLATIIIFFLFSSTFATAQSPIRSRKFMTILRVNGVVDSSKTRGGKLVVDTSNHLSIQVDAHYVHVGDTIYRIVKTDTPRADYFIYTVKKLNDKVFTEADSVTWEFQLFLEVPKDSIYRFIALQRHPIMYQGRRILNNFGHYYCRLVPYKEAIVYPNATIKADNPLTPIKWEQTYSLLGTLDTNSVFTKWKGPRKDMVITATGLRFGKDTITFIGNNHHGDTAFYTFDKGTVLIGYFPIKYKKSLWLDNIVCCITTAADRKIYELQAYGSGHR